MNIVLLAPTKPSAGGIARWTNRMMKSKFPDNIKLSIVDEKLIGNRNAFGDNIKRNYFNEIKRSFNIWKNLIFELKKEDTKIVHSCIPSTSLAMIREYICCMLTKFYKKKFVIHFRCTVPNTTKGKIGRFILKRICNSSDYIIALNKQTKSFLSNITNTKCTIIPNFVSKEEILDKHYINDKIKTILYVGGVTNEKGVKDILEVARQFSEIQFRFIGKAESNIINYAKENEISNAVFLGVKEKNEIKKELENADVFMFLSYYFGEGFSNALAEAMASGLPCIVSNWAANADMIDKNGGIVVPIKSPKHAVAAINKLSKKSVREKESIYNINKVKKYYSDEIVLDSYIKIYKSLI